MVELIQVLATIIALFAISRAILRLKDRKLNFKSFIFWCAIWLGIIIVVFSQEATFYVSRLVGIERGIDFFVYLSIVILFYLVFRVYVKIEGIEQEITAAVRKIALNKKRKK